MNTKVIYSFKEYQVEYDNLLNDFLNDYDDNTNEDFISEQLQFYSICLDNVVFTDYLKGNDDISWKGYGIKAEVETYNLIEEISDKIFVISREENSLYKHYDPYINIELCKQYERSFKKIISFLEDKLIEIEKLKMGDFIKPNSEIAINEIKTLNWQGKELEFTELVKALFESKMLNPELSQKEVFKRLKLFFEIDEFNENDKIKEITNRTNTPTPFLNILETALNNYRNKQIEKKKDK